MHNYCKDYKRKCKGIIKEIENPSINIKGAGIELRDIDDKDLLDSDLYLDFDPEQMKLDALAKNSTKEVDKEIEDWLNSNKNNIRKKECDY